MNENIIKLNVKQGNYLGFFDKTKLGLILGKVVEFDDNSVLFDNCEERVDYASIRRIEIKPYNCESFGWKRYDTRLSSFIIEENEADVIFDNEQPVLEYKTESGIKKVNHCCPKKIS